MSIEQTETTDPRIDAVAIALGEEDPGSCGWVNWTDHYRGILRMRAARLVAAADAADPIRNYIKDKCHD